MEKGEENTFCWNRNERKHVRIKISVLETSFKDLEGNVEDASLINKQSFCMCWSFKVVENLLP